MQRDPGSDAFARVAAALDLLADADPGQWSAVAREALDDPAERAWALRLAHEELTESSHSGEDETGSNDAAVHSRAVRSAARAFPDLVGDLAGDPSRSESSPARAATESPESLPERIGEFRILERLGVGGMGEVYLGLRSREGFEQRVAIKRMRATDYDREAEARFLREREILAGLEHPGIARLIDGGKSDDGRLFYAMEYVDGQPITVACDQLQLTLEQRLPVFLDVCAAVAAAHRHPVLHRDLKPANILMTTERQVKLVDFGIAKPLLHGGHEQPATIQRAFTPEYAAPEQQLGQSTTTATDIYGLGLVLYELLVGVAAYRASTTTDLTLERQIRRGVAPARAAWSQVESTLGAAELDRIARARKTTLGQIERTLQGDLGNILRMALRAEPSERYANVEALRTDLESYLALRPVSATRGNFWYQARKLAQRHRLTATVAALAAVLVGAGIVGTLTQGARAERERDRAVQAEAEARAVNRFLLDDLVGNLSPDVTQASRVTIGEITDLAAARLQQGFEQTPEIRRTIHLRLAALYLDQGNGPAAQAQLDEATALPAPVGEPSWRVPTLRARTLLMNGEISAAERALEELRRDHGSQLAGDAANLAELELLSAEVQRQAGNWSRSEEQLRALISQLEALDERPWAVLLRAQRQLAEALAAQRRTPEAILLAEQVLAEQRLRLGPNHPEIISTANGLTLSYVRAERSAEALRNAEQTVEMARRVLGEGHPLTLDSLNLLAWSRDASGNPETAAQEFGVLSNLAARQRGEYDPKSIGALMNQGVVFSKLGRVDEALQSFRLATERFESSLGEDHPSTVRAIRNQQGLLRRMGRIEEADLLVERLLVIGHRRARQDHPDPTLLADFAANLAFRFPPRYRDAEQALEYVQRAHAAGHGESFEVMTVLARVHQQLGDLEAALEVVERAAKLPEALYTHSLERTTIDLAVQLQAADRGERILRAIQQGRSAARPPEDPLHGTSNRRLSELFRRTHRPQEALEEAVAAVAAYRLCCGDDSFEMALGLVQRGRVLVDLAHFDEAEQDLLQAQRLFERDPVAIDADRRQVSLELERLAAARRARDSDPQPAANPLF